MYVVWLFLRVKPAIMPHLKEEGQGYLCIKNLDNFPTDKYFITIFLSRAGVYNKSSTFWTAILLFVIADRTTIPHSKEE